MKMEKDRQRYTIVIKTGGNGVNDQKNMNGGMAQGILMICLILLACMLFPSALAAGNEKNSFVRVGYYENEVFQEGAKAGLVKTGYAYEYYRKISEYTGWKYEYIYGDSCEAFWEY